MVYAEARRRVAERSLASVGRSRDDATAIETHTANPVEHARKLFNGLLEPDDLERLLYGLSLATSNALQVVHLAREHAEPGEVDLAGSLYVFLSQQVLMGLLLAREN